MSKLFKLLVLVGLVSGCSTDVMGPRNDVASGNSQGSTKSQSSGANERAMPSSMYWIQQNANGEYLSAYGGGITFGTSFIHLTIVDPTGATDGQPMPGFQYVAFQGPMLSSVIDGAKFDLVEPTFPEAVTIDEVTTYFDDLKKYWDGDTTARPAPIGSTTGAGGVLEITGVVVRDHTSPTNASVVAESGVASPPPSLGVFLGYLPSGGYRLYFYRASNASASSGSVANATAFNSSGASVGVTNFSLSYSIDSTGGQYLIVGTLHLSTGVTLSINGYVIAP